MTEQKQPRVISGPLSTDDIAVARRLVERAERVDGVPPLAEQARLAIESGADLHLRSEHGYANVIAARDGGAAMVEAVVDPDHRGVLARVLLGRLVAGHENHLQRILRAAPRSQHTGGPDESCRQPGD